MLVPFVQLEAILCSDNLLTQVALEPFFVNIHHVLHVAVFLLEHFVADLALLPVVLIVGVVVPTHMGHI